MEIELESSDHAGPFMEDRFSFDMAACEHVLAVRMVVCGNCGAHFIVVFLGWPHGGGKCLGTANGKAIGDITWLYTRPGRCNCGIMRRLISEHHERNKRDGQAQ